MSVFVTVFLKLVTLIFLFIYGFVWLLIDVLLLRYYRYLTFSALPGLGYTCRQQLCSVVIKEVNRIRDEELSLEDYSLPKLKLGFKTAESENLPQLAVGLTPLPNAFASVACIVRPRRFESWSEFERVIPGTKALFSISVTEQFLPIFPGSNTASIQRKIIIWKVVEDDLTPFSAVHNAKMKAGLAKKPEPQCTVSNFFFLSF